MKRFLLSILAAVVCVAASAEFRWGPTAGVNVTSYKYSQDLFAIDPSVGGSAELYGIFRSSLYYCFVSIRTSKQQILSNSCF